jgi:hypothetical protein
MKPFNLEFQNNVLLLFLPSIHTQNSNLQARDRAAAKELFTDMLKDIINKLSLSKNYTYKLYFSLFLHTNDESKDLTYYLAPTYFAEHSDNVLDMIKAKFLFGIMYKKQGYCEFHTDFLDFRSFNTSSIKYAEKILKILGTKVIHMNEHSREDGFVDFKKSVLLKITRSSVK